MSGNSVLSKMISSVKNARVGKNLSFVAVNSGVVRGCLDVLIQLGYISGYKVSEDTRTVYAVVNSVFGDKAISNIVAISKPSKRFYATVDNLREMRMKNQFITYVVSTSCGIMSSSDALKKNIGGEVLFFVC